ncbi:hypothetical protein [Pelagibacterium lacus]|uniref:hypothetical protein n=1 Tax=Pelagibacterium lacus TaxID=2282655 RepID=UPI0011C02A0C|nr:hypothetical protein [Pelagibacterium lacus]
MLEDVGDGWKTQGWTITRYRPLDNGSLNIAAIDPATGDGFALDSSFETEADIYVVGFFNTPCHKHSPGPAPFGRMEWDAD